MFALCFDVKFNSTKSVARRIGRIGRRFRVNCAPLVLAGSTLKFVYTVKYLGIRGPSQRFPA